MSNISHAMKVIDNCDLQVLINQRDEEGNPCFSIGQRDELGAGLYGFKASPCFDSMEELYDWVNDNETQLTKKYITPYVE